MWEKFLIWCGSDTASAKVTRTIFQGALSFLAVMLPNWAGANMPPEVVATILPCIMAVLAYAQSWLGSKGTLTGGGDR